MNNRELMIFFEEMNTQLKKLNSTYISYEEKKFQLNFEIWKKRLLTKLSGAYYIRVKRMSIDYYSEYSYNFPVLQTILRDMYWKYKEKEKTEKNIKIEKLLQARENNIDFEIELAEMIMGNNPCFPFSGYNFFQNVGLPFVYNGEFNWIEEILEELNIIKIYKLLSHENGLFKEKRFIKNGKDFLRAQKEFKNFINSSIEAGKSFDLSNVLDMNINVELLFDNKANTKDDKLNKLIEEAKERFVSNDKQIGLEKLWDAYERLRTHFGKNKKVSAPKVIKIISENFDEEFLTDEFFRLGKIGNNYRIRHHETDKKELTSKHINYFFFRMMSLIDLCLMYLNKEELQDLTGIPYQEIKKDIFKLIGDKIDLSKEPFSKLKRDMAYELGLL